MIACTSGFIGGMYTSPLISRTNWKIEGHLKGHEKSVNISVSAFTLEIQSYAQKRVY